MYTVGPVLSRELYQYVFCEYDIIKTTRHLTKFKAGNTVVSQTSAHGRLQLKHQKLGVGVYTKEVLKYQYPHASPHPKSKVS